MKRSRLRPISARRRKRDKGYSAARDEAYARSEGRCEAGAAPECNGRAEQCHHRAGRGGSNPHRLDNIVVVCAPCHKWAHDNVAAAYESGLMVRRLTERGPA